MLTQVSLAWLEEHASDESVAQAAKHTVAQVIAGALAATVRLLTAPEIRWQGCQPSIKQRIYIANHTSHADFVLLWGSLPSHLREATHPVAAADYWTRGLIRRRLMRDVFHGVLIDRDLGGVSQNPLAPLLRALDAGKSLILFPEGTRGNGERVRPFRGGIYHVGRAHPDVELIPVWIDNLHRVLPRGAFLPVPLHCSLIFGTPTRLEPGEDQAAFRERLRQNLIELRPHADPS